MPQASSRPVMARYKDLKKLDARFLFRGDEAADQVEVVRSDGSWIIGPGGRRYIDFVMGWNVGNLGWGNEDIKKIVSDYDGTTYVQQTHLYKPWAELAELLVSAAPVKRAQCVRATGGSEAVDLALRAAMAHTGRSKFVSIKGAYHGQTLATLSVGSAELVEGLPCGRVVPCAQIEPPLGVRAVKQLEQKLKRRDVAAFIMEPIVCNLAVEVPEPEFMEMAQHLCKKYGTLLIVDEVATGFGRTGKLFASEHYDIEPDILCLAKAMSGGVLGIGATLCRTEVAASLGFTYSTYGWHPLSVAVALNTLRTILKHQRSLLEHVERIGQYLCQRLSRIDFGCDVQIRAKGLAIGLKLEGEGRAAPLVAAALDRGLLISEISDDSVAMFPALNVEQEIASRAMDILEDCAAANRERSAA